VDGVIEQWEEWFIYKFSELAPSVSTTDCSQVTRRVRLIVITMRIATM
jgi:hypothetical protein